MRGIVGFLTISRLAAAGAALWLCGTGPAKAGDGADLAGLQNYIDDACSAFGMSSCPQIPSITQAVLQVAAFANIAPEAVRSDPFFAIPVGPYIDAGNPSHPPGLQCLGTGCVDPLNPIAFPVDPGDVLSSLRPLAFISAKSGTTATPTQLYDESATAFLYAVGGTTIANSSQPDTLVLFYDDPIRTAALSPGQVGAKISLPLTVLNKDGTERSVPAVLQYVVPQTGAAPCSASTISGSFSGNGTQTRTPAQIGVNCAVKFAASPASPDSQHAIFEVSIPMLITFSTDPAIYDGSLAGFADPFFEGGGDSGFKPASGVIGSSQSIGIGPNAAPLGPATPSGGTATYALCANLPTTGSTLLPSVAAFYGIGGDGVVRLSAPLGPTVISYVCPPM